MTRNGQSGGVGDESVAPGTVFDRLLGSDAGGERNTRRPTVWTGLLLILCSVAVSVLSYVVLPDPVRIRWSVGTYYGPEFAPAIVFATAFPVFIAGLFVGFRALARSLERRYALADIRPIYAATAVGVLLAVLFSQVAILMLNLL